MIPTCKKLYLCNQSLDPLCVINGLRTETVDLHIRIKDYSTLSFEVDKYINIDGKLVLSNGYDELNVYMYIYLEDVGYFKMQHPSIINDGNNEIKIINANSIEQEFEDKDWINFKCNTGETDSLEQLATDNLNDLGFAKEFVKFYNPKNKELSLLHIILTKMPGWTINDDDIDPLLWDTKLSLNESNINLYALLTSRIAPKADCIFVFNILNRTIKAIHKNNLDDFDTNIFIGYRNLAQEIDINVDEDSVYTSFNCSGADDLNIDNWNYNSSTLYNFDYFLSSPRLSTELIAKIKTWQKWRNDNREEFANLSKQRADKNDKIYVLKYKVPDDSVDWKQWDNMEEDLLLKNQKYYQALLTSLQVSVDDDPQYTKDEQGNNKEYIPWKNSDGTINHELYLEKLYNLENGYGGYYTYLEIINYVLPNIQTAIQNLGVVTDQKKDYVKEYETNWELYGIEELKTKQKDYENKLTSLSQFAIAWDMLADTDKAKYPGGEKEYNTLGRSEYVKYQNYLGSETTSGSLLFQLKKLNDELSELSAELDTIDSQRLALVEQAQMTHSSYGFTNKELVAVSRLQRHTDYQNSNILSTSVDTTVTRINKEKELYDDCIEKLSEVSQPQFSFSARIDNFLRIPEFKDWEKDFKLLKFIRLGIRDDYSVKLRLVGYQWNPCEITDDLTLEFSNMITSKNGRSDLTNLLTNESYRGSKNSYSIGIGNSDSDKEYLTTLLQLMIGNNLFKNSVSNIASNTTPTIDSAQISNLVSEYIKVTKIDVSQIYGDEAHFEKMFTDYLSADFIATKLISADSGTFTELSSKIINSGKANIEEIVSKSIQAENIYVDKIIGSDGEFTNFFVNHLNVNDVFGNNADFNNIIAVNISASQLSTDVANILTLINGNLTSDNIHSLTLNSKNTTIENGMIKNAMIESLAFDKITGIDVNTTKLTVHSEDGKSTWRDNTIQISDVNRVRVQIGKDATGDYTLAVWDASGNLIWDALGATENTIQRKIIRDDVVADDAAISGSKLDIESVVKEVNGATTKLKSTTILFDDKNQTLDVVFNEMENTVSENSETLTTHTTNISTIQGQISSLIAEDTTIKGDYNALVSKYNSTVSEVDSIKTTIGEHTTLLDSQSDKILAVQTKANTIESDLSGTKQTVSSVQTDLNSTKSRVTTVETGLDGLKTRVSNAETTLKKKADGTTVDSLTSRVSTCESTLDGFETSLTATNKTVSDNYVSLKNYTDSAKSSAISTASSDASTKANNVLASAKSYAEGQASTALNNAKSYADAGIAGVQVGGRNYLVNTSIPNSIKATNTNGFHAGMIYWTAEKKKLSELGFKVGDVVTVSLDWEVTDATTYGFFFFEWYGGDSNTYIARASNDTWRLSNDNLRGYIVFSCTLTSAMLNARSLARRIDNSALTLTLKRVKLEKGNKATDWSPAPEDIQSQIDLTNATVTTHTEQISSHDTRITAAESAITLKVSTSDFTSYKTTVTGQISTAKTEAINSAASDATSKANQALKDAKAYTTAEITTVNEHLTKTDQTISVMQGQIALKVEQTDIDTAVQGIQVGGRNLLINTSTNKSTTVNTSNGFITFDPYRTNNNATLKDLGFKSGDKVTISFNWNISKNGSLDIVYGNFSVEWVKNGNYLGLIKKPVDAFSSTNTSGKVMITTTLDNAALDANTVRIRIDNSVLIFTILKMKLEKGNKATDWTPAPEDIDSSISAVDAKFANYSTTTQMTAAITAAKDSITQSVSATYATKSSLETANSNITSLTSRVQTAESKLTKDGLTTIVGDYYTTANVVDSKINGIQVGGRNLVRDSDVLGNYFLPAGGYAGRETIVDDTEAKSGKHIEFKCITAGNGPHTPIFPKTTDKVGKVYTWSFWAKSSVDKSGNVGHECGGVTPISLTTSWKKFTHTWTFTDGAYESFVWYLYWKVDEILYVRDFKIEEGNKATDWTPAPEDVDSSISAVQTIATQTADKFNWLVKSGTSSTDFTLTDRTATLVANAINLKGLVTFSGLDSAAQRKITTAQSTADTAKENAATAQSTADTARKEIASLGNITVKKYIFNGTESAKWVKLGTLVSNGDSSNTVITVYSGAGFNSAESQNSQAEIVIKDGWQSSPSATTSFGVSVTRQNCEELIVKVMASSHNTCDVWVYMPWAYWNGMYTIVGAYSSWTNSGMYQDSEPSSGVSQSVGYRANAENAQASANLANTTLANWCYNNDKTYINGGKIYTGTIAAAQIASNAITTDKLGANSVTADKITSKAITADKINVTSLSSISADLGSITAGSINIGSGKFTVSSAGVMTATGATISGTVTATSGSFTGTVTATSGTIGGCAISNGVLQIKKANIAEKLTASQIDVNNLFAQSITATGTITGAKLSGATGNFTGNITATTLTVSDNINLSVGTGTAVNIASLYSEDLVGTGNQSVYFGQGTLNTYIVGSPVIFKTYNNSRSFKFWGIDNTTKYSIVEMGTLKALSITKNGTEVSVEGHAHTTLAASGTPPTGITANSTSAFILDGVSTGIAYRMTSAAFNAGNNNLGSPSYRWSNIFSAAALNVSSDGKLKENFKSFNDAYEKMYMELEPVLYTFRNVSDTDSHDRTHGGFDARKVETVMNKYGLKEKDFAFLCKDDVSIFIDDNGNPNNPYEKYGITDYLYGLKYEEMIPLNTHMTQKAIRHQEEQDRNITLMSCQIAFIDGKYESKISALKSQGISLEYQLQQAFMQIAELKKQIEQLLTVG